MKMTNLEKQFVNSPGHSKRVSDHADALLKLVDFEAGQTYLDVGCGNGAAPIHIAKKYHLEATGIDVDPDQIRQAEALSQGLSNVRFLTIDGVQLPFEDNEFDIVSTNKVMHHIPKWETALAEMVRVLKPNGYLIYSDFVYPGWIAALGKLVVNNYAGFPTSKALNTVVAQNHLSEIHLSKSFLSYEAVFQKNATS
jgi:ubiquinone/menaquinone biosynthesis C-methylase UbiE